MLLETMLEFGHLSADDWMESLVCQGFCDSQLQTRKPKYPATGRWIHKLFNNKKESLYNTHDMNKTQNHNTPQNKLDTQVHLVCFYSHEQVKLTCDEGKSEK